MAFRLTVGVLALITVCVAVFFEFYLSYSGVFTLRDELYNTGYEAISNSAMIDDSMGDSLLTVLVYTFPEGVALLVLYHLYALAGRSLGLVADESDAGS